MTPGWTRRQALIGWGAMAVSVALPGRSRGTSIGGDPLLLDPGDVRVPQTVLGIVHSTEGQRELPLKRADRDAFETFLQRVDADWMKSRSRTEKERRRIISGIESEVVREVERRFGDKGVARLRQLELQAQGLRVLLRPEIGRVSLMLTEDQMDRIGARIGLTDAAGAEFRRLRIGDAADRDRAESADADWRRLKGTEDRDVAAELTEAQRTRLATALGRRVDTTRFQRIHPIVPELIDTGHWLRDRRVTLSDLRGKVVLVHFYAFECRNCRANFATYNRWNSAFGRRGVEIVGIQSPETAAERDPERVLAAAKEDGFEFPVMADPKRRNWDAWGVDSWPTIHLVDKRGYLRHWWVGELTWPGTRGDIIVERLVDALLAESAA